MLIEQIATASGGDIEDISLGGEGPGGSTVLSSARLYNIQFTGANCNSSSSGGKCWLSQRLEYYGSTPCESHFVCPVLLENPCGDFELSLKFPGASHDVCHQGKHYIGRLSFDTELEVSLWVLDSSQVSLSCFMWCTADGEMPQLSGRQAPEGGDTDIVIIETVKKTLFRQFLLQCMRV